MYTVLARKWRPQVFEDLAGQQTVTKTLQNAILSGRIAHAFLFSGPRGVGKTTCARVLAKALNCHSSNAPVVTPCNECASCVDISASRSLDVLEIDGASNRGIDEVRELRESAKYQPMRDRFRIYIIDEVHMLTTEAFNALLKILEEPPPHVFFIFATTEFRKVPATIVSRCQPFDFKRIPDRVLVQRLTQITREEQIDISEKSLGMIATASEGGLRDALGTLDQIIAFSGKQVDEKDVETVLGLVDTEILIELAGAISNADGPAVLSVLDRISEFGVDYKIFYNELLAFYRDLFLVRYGSSQTTDERLKKLATEYNEVHLLRICHQLVSIQSLIKFSGNLRFLMEITLVKLSQIRRLVPIEELVESVKKNTNVTSVAVDRKTDHILQLSKPATQPGPAAVFNSGASVALNVTSSAANAAGSNHTDQPLVQDDFLAALISQMEAKNPRLAAVLEQSSFHQKNSTLCFYVPDHLFQRSNPQDQVFLQTILREKLGTEIQVEIHKGNPPTETQASKVATPETLVESDPVVREFIKAFKGKISKIDLNKERYL